MAEQIKSMIMRECMVSLPLCLSDKSEGRLSSAKSKPWYTACTQTNPWSHCLSAFSLDFKGLQHPLSFWALRVQKNISTLYSSTLAELWKQVWDFHTKYLNHGNSPSSFWSTICLWRSISATKLCIYWQIRQSWCVNSLSWSVQLFLFFDFGNICSRWSASLCCRTCDFPFKFIQAHANLQWAIFVRTEGFCKR